MESTILKPTEQTTQEQDIKIIKSIINKQIEDLNSIKNIYEYKPTNKEDQEPNKQYYYFKNDKQIIKNIEILKELEKELIESKNPKETIKKYFKIKIGNIKLNDLVFNFSSGHLCYSFLNNYCNNCNICYAFKYEYSKSTLKSRLANTLFIEYVITSYNYYLLEQVIKETDLNKLIKEYNNIIKNQIRKELKRENPRDQELKELESKIIKDITLIKNIRIDEIGELENRHYTFLKFLLQCIKKYLIIDNELKYKYTYSHNPKLNIKRFKEIININKSLNYIECKEYLKNINYNLTHNIYCNCKDQEEAKRLETYLKEHNIKYCYCLADCTKCSYCKTNIKRVIITYNH